MTQDVSELERQARIFAADVTDLLNGTVTHGVRFSAVIANWSTTKVLVGRGLTTQNFRADTIPVTLGRKPPHVHLYVAYVLEWDPEGVYLAVSKSQYGIYLDDTKRAMLVHWDYERDPVNKYPAAHIQVNGLSEHFDTLCGHAREHLRMDCPDRPLRDFHFPVGGRRFRPTLEEVIEFLIVEDLVESRPYSDEVIARHRTLWEERQLCAAVRRNPDLALSQLREDGHLD